MSVLALFIILYYFKFSNADDMVPGELEHMLFGNLASMQDLYIKEGANGSLLKDFEPSNSSDTIDDSDGFSNPQFATTGYQFPQANLSKHDFDVLDYNMINDKLANLSTSNNTRRTPLRYGYVDYDDTYLGENIELYKQDLLRSLCIQFLMHVRYEVGKALTQRDGKNLRQDKRYRLGYLFNRLRRLKTEQLKVVAIAYVNYDTKFRSLPALLRLYERVVQFDIDIRDTSKLIKDIYVVEAVYDKYSRDPSKPQRYDDGRGPVYKEKEVKFGKK